ncbi:MAG: hypothetical protein Q4G03_08330 [Planctomycetia bacterium]|nr:hypothetical protein [Planctomycetia bacterium]
MLRRHLSVLFSKTRSATLLIACLSACALTSARADDAVKSSYAADARPSAHAQGASEFAERLLLLEFSDKHDAKCVASDNLLNLMRRKNYPIQRVERANGGQPLFEQYNIKTVPTHVLLFDGKEIGRVVVKRDSIETTRDRLLKLFQQGRDQVAAQPRARMKEPQYIAQNRPKFGFLFPKSMAQYATARGQDSTFELLASDAQTSGSSDVLSILDSRTEEISNLIGEARVEEACARVEVADPFGGPTRLGAAVVIHYNAQYKEILSVVPSSLFLGYDNPIVQANVGATVMHADNQEETVGAQCVYCDFETGVAFVAAPVEKPTLPAVFLPKKLPLELGERAQMVARDSKGYHATTADVLAVDQRQFYHKDSAVESASFMTSLVSGASPEVDGGALFVVRNGRYYFAGLRVMSDAQNQSVVASISTLCQALLTNRNLAAVYRDQIASKFDLPATDSEIDAAIAKLAILDKNRPATTTAPEQTATSTDNSVALSEPQTTAEPSAPLVLGASSEPNANVESVLSANLGDTPDPSVFPSTANDAFAQVDVLAQALNASAATPAASQEALANNSQFIVNHTAAESAASASTPNASALLAQADAAAVPAPVAAPEAVVAPTQVDALAQAQPVNAPAPVADLVPITPTAELYGQVAPQVAANAAPEPTVVSTPAEILAQPAPAQTTIANQSVATPAAQVALVAQAPVNQEHVANATALQGLETPQTVAQQPVAQQPVAPVAPVNNQLLVADAAQAAAAPAIQNVAQPVAESAVQPVAPQVVAQQPVVVPMTDQVASAPVAASNAIRSTTFNAAPDPKQVEAFEREEEQFEAGIDALRRRSMEGAEIICIVNWNSDPNSNAPRETEVVRLPRRSVLVNPAAPRTGIELAETPTVSDANHSAAYAPEMNPTPAPAYNASLPPNDPNVNARILK